MLYCLPNSPSFRTSVALQVVFNDSSGSSDLSAVQADGESSYAAEESSFVGFTGEVRACVCHGAGRQDFRVRVVELLWNTVDALASRNLGVAIWFLVIHLLCVCAAWHQLNDQVLLAKRQTRGEL